MIIVLIVISITMLNLTECKLKSKKYNHALIGRWRMIKSEFECPKSQQASTLNSISAVNDTQIVLKFSDSSFQTFYPEALRPPVAYKFEEDTLIVNYPHEDPPYVSKAFIEFLSSDKLVMREPRKELNCILVSTLKRIQ